MPWVLEETFAAGGLDLHAEVTLRRLDPLYRIRWAGEERALRLHRRRRRGCAREVARFSARDAARVEPFLAALRPIYEQAILGAGRRPFGSRARLRAARARRWCGSARCGRCTRFVARYFEHPRVREAFSFHSLFIGGDPYRVPAIYGALVYLQVLDGGWYADGGVYSLVEAMARAARRPLRRAGRADRARRRARDRRARWRAASGSRPTSSSPTPTCCARTSCSGRRAPRRRLRPTMSCFLLYLGTDRRVRARCCTTRCWSATATASSSARVTRGRELPRTFSTYVHAPARTEPAMAAAGGDSLAVLLPVPNLRAGIDWDARGRPPARRAGRRPRDELRARRAARRGRRRAPHDAARLRARARRRVGQRVRGRADAAPVARTSASPTATAASPGCTTSAAARIPAPASRACCSAPRSRPGWSRPTAAAAPHGRSARVSAVAPRAAPPRARCSPRRARRRNRVARTFSLACRLLPRELRDDVYLLYLVFRTLDDLVDDGAPEAAARVAAVERVGARAARARARARSRCSRTSPRATRCRAPRSPTSARACAGTSTARAFAHRGRRSTRYCYRVAGTVGMSMAAVLGTDDDARAAAGRGRARDGDAAHEHPARHRRGPRRRPRLPRPRDDRRASARRAPGAREGLLRDQIARADARYEEGLAGIALLRTAARAVARRGVDVPRDPAPDRARGLRRARRAGRRRAAARASCASRRGAASLRALTRVCVRPCAGARRRGGAACSAPRRRRPAPPARRRRRRSRCSPASRPRPGRLRRRTRAPARRRGAPRAAGAGAPPSCPRGGRSMFPDRRIVAFYGAPQDDELGRARHRLARRRPRGGSPRQARPYERPTPPGAARAGAASP